MNIPFSIFALLLCLLLGACSPPEKRAESPAIDKTPKLACWEGRALGAETAPIKVQTVLPVNNGCQDAVGVYLAEIATQFPQVFQVQILGMKSDAGRTVMKEKKIRCAMVLINGTTTFDLGDDDKFMLEGPMDPADVRRALLHTAETLGIEKIPELPPAPKLPGIEQMRKRILE